MKDSAQWTEEGDYSPGQYKWATNYTILPNGKEYFFMNYQKVPQAMKDLCSETNEMLKKIDESKIDKHPLYIASNFHYKFTDIHPFADGNGRVGRIFTNLILIKADYTPFIIKEEDRSNYIDQIIEARENNDPRILMKYFGEKLETALQNKLDYYKNEVQKSNKIGINPEEENTKRNRGMLLFL